MSKAINDVVAERARQVIDEGYTADKDDHYIGGVLSLAGAAYAVSGSRVNGIGTFSLRARNLWPWPDKSGFKPCGSNHAFTRRKDLVKAAALIIAEIERIDRLKK